MCPTIAVESDTHQVSIDQATVKKQWRVNAGGDHQEQLVLCFSNFLSVDATHKCEIYQI
jgi:hypothetical protein